MPDRERSFDRRRSWHDWCGRVVARLAIGAVVLTLSGVSVDSVQLASDDATAAVARTPDADGTQRRAEPVSVVDAGAVADDGHDDLEAFRRAVSRAAATGTSVLVPAGQFELSSVLELDSVAMVGVGTKSVVVSTAPYLCSIVLKGTAPEIRNLRRVVSSPGVRTGQLGTQSIVVDGARDFVVADLVVFHATGAGIFVRRATGGTVSGNVIKRTGADGIHLTDGTQNVRVVANTVRNSADDGIAVVSYDVNAAVSHDILIRGNRVDLGGTRGLSVVGGEDVSLTDNVVTNSALAGIYIATESSFSTRDTLRIAVDHNVVRNSPTTARSGHTSVLVYASGGIVDEIKFRDNSVVISATQGYGVTCMMVLGRAVGTVGDVYFTRNSVKKAQQGPTRFLTGVLHLRDNVGF